MKAGPSIILQKHNNKIRSPEITTRFPAVLFMICVLLAACGTDNGGTSGGNLNIAEFKGYDDCHQVSGDASDVISEGYQTKMYDEENSYFPYSYEWDCIWVYEKQDEFDKEHGCSGTCTSTERLGVDYFAGSRINYPITEEYAGDSRIHPVTRQDVINYLLDDERHGPLSYEIINSPQLTQSGYDNIIIARQFNSDIESRIIDYPVGLEDYWIYHMIVLGPYPEEYGVIRRPVSFGKM